MVAPGILAFLAEIVLIALHRARSVAYVAVAENLTRVALSAGALACGGGVLELTLILFGTRVFAFLSYMAVFMFRVPIGFARWPDREILRNIGRVLPVFLTHTIFSLVLSRLDFVLLSFYTEHISLEALGHYSVAYRLFEICLLVAMSLWMALFPDLARQFGVSAEAFVVRARFVFRFILFSAIPASMLAFAFSPLYVRWLFPAHYPTAVPMAQLFALTLIPAVLDTYLSSVLNASNRQARDLGALAAGGAVYAASLALFIPIMGLQGAWLAGFLAIATQLTFRLQVYPLLRRKEFVQAVVLASAIGAAAFAICRDTETWGGLILLALLVPFYPVILWLSGILQPGRWLRFVNRRHVARSSSTWPGLGACRANARQTREPIGRFMA
jgi:O-antigen/teichoic acid export membrane protein